MAKLSIEAYVFYFLIGMYTVSPFNNQKMRKIVNQVLDEIPVRYTSQILYKFDNLVKLSSPISQKLALRPRFFNSPFAYTT